MTRRKRASDDAEWGSRRPTLASHRSTLLSLLREGRYRKSCRTAFAAVLVATAVALLVVAATTNQSKSKGPLVQPTTTTTTETSEHLRNCGKRAYYGPPRRRRLEAQLNEYPVRLPTKDQETGPSTAGFPSVEESTLMFMHIFKCAGSTVRRLMVEWAEEEGKSGAIVSSCDDVVHREGRVCLHDHNLLDVEVQTAYMATQKVLAGHFVWGFAQYVKPPTLMITTLRNPLEVCVSAQQFLHRKETKTLESASTYVRHVMLEILKNGGHGKQNIHWEGVNIYQEPKELAEKGETPQQAGFIRRFVGAAPGTLYGEALEQATTQAIENMNEFWLVGVVEQYAGFMAVLRRMLDPSETHAELWQKFLSAQSNRSPVGSSDVLAEIDPYLVSRYNDTLALQWSLYDHAVDLYSHRCLEVLPVDLRETLCTVRAPRSKY